MMNAAAGIFLGSRRGPALPYDAEVEYLESTGTQWIDTGVVPTGATGIDCDFVMLNTKQNFSPVFWSRGSSNADRAFCFEGEATSVDTKGQARWDYGSYGPKQVRNVIKQDVRTSASVRSGTLTVAGNTLSRAAQTFIGAGSIILFNLCNYVDGQRQMIIAAVQPVRIYSCAIYNSTLVRDFQPVRFTNELGQSEGAMYDRVNPTGGMNPDGSPRTDGIYRNRGTGAFSWGADKTA